MFKTVTVTDGATFFKGRFQLDLGHSRLVRYKENISLMRKSALNLLKADTSLKAGGRKQKKNGGMESGLST